MAILEGYRLVMESRLIVEAVLSALRFEVESHSRDLCIIGQFDLFASDFKYEILHVRCTRVFYFIYCLRLNTV